MTTHVPAKLASQIKDVAVALLSPFADVSRLEGS